MKNWPMKTVLERLNQENNQPISFSNNHGAVYAAERLADGYFLGKVAKYFWGPDIFSLLQITKDPQKIYNGKI